MASKDMANISEEVPTTYMILNCKVEENDFSHHNPGVLFDEAAIPYGITYFITSAIAWLNK